jgi:hypothetical protein
MEKRRIINLILSLLLLMSLLPSCKTKDDDINGAMVVLNEYAYGSDEFSEGEICGVHNKGMVKGKVSVAYGLIRPNDTEMKYYESRYEYFPNCDDFVFGGCVVGDPYAEKYICKECNKERDKYTLKYGK